MNQSGREAKRPKPTQKARKNQVRREIFIDMCDDPADELKN
jgi:hypothetical protein